MKNIRCSDCGILEKNIKQENAQLKIVNAEDLKKKL